MIGKSDNCIATSTEKLCNDLPCNHVEYVKNLYSVKGLYDSSVIGLIVDCILKQQTDFLSLMCESSIPLENLVKITGFTGCVEPIIDNGCITICGDNYREYALDKCNSCEYTSFDDSFYTNVFKLYRSNRYPSRDMLKSIIAIFGWEVIYTPDYINIDINNDNPEKTASIIKMISIPIGVKIRIIGNC